MRILIAEDDTVSRLVLSALLKKLGHTVTAVDNGAKAWDAFRQEPFPVVITDLAMPEMDGLDLCRAIRASELPRPYLMLLTASGSEQGSDWEGVGADSYQVKPVSEETLAGCLIRVESVVSGQ
jgi:CheY-like chemotaxis protein